MNIDNITSDGVTLNSAGKSMQIKVYEDLLKKKDEEPNQYKNNWEELKKWIKEDKEKAENTWEMGRCFNMFDILNKMKELEDDI